MTKIYEVTIASAGSATQGFIDHVKIQHYVDDLTGLTVDQCMAKRRANFRWERILGELSMVANPAIQSIEAVGATASSNASSFKFVVAFSNENAILTTVNDVQLNSIDSLKYLVAAALVGDTIKHCTVPDPTVPGMVEFIIDLAIDGLALDNEEAMDLVSVIELA